MGIFKIDVKNLNWLGGTEDTDDLCLHGDVKATIGNDIFEYNATVSSTALYLLKSLTQDHIIYEENQMLPCCGFFMIADDNLMNVDICGCPNGIDWTVLHKNNEIKIITESGAETVVDFEEYKNEVYAFADRIEDFYNNSAPRNLPKDEFDRNGYVAFWNEWHRRRNR